MAGIAMALAFYYRALPRPYIHLLELIGILKYVIFLCSRRFRLRILSPHEHQPDHHHLEAPHGSPQPSPDSIKERLPVARFQNLVQRWELLEETQHMCAICMSYLDGSHEVRELCNCHHVFHRACIDVWVDEGQLSCPLCRSELITS